MIKKLYETLYSRRGAYHQRFSLFKREKAYFISKWLKNSTLILDIGTGDGALLKEVSKLLPNSVIIGIDISLIALMYAKKILSTSNLLVASAEYLPFRESCFDGCYSSETIEHLHNPDYMLSDCFRILKPEGKMVVTTPNSRFFRNREKSSLHVKEYDHQQLGYMFERQGFKVNMIGGFNVGILGYKMLHRLFLLFRCERVYFELTKFVFCKLYSLVLTLFVFCTKKRKL